MSAFVIVRNRIAAESTREIVNPFELLPERSGEQKTIPETEAPTSSDASVIRVQSRSEVFTGIAWTLIE
jgi:hypothetical protein